jgi:hypothetical protein
LPFYRRCVLSNKISGSLNVFEKRKKRGDELIGFDLVMPFDADDGFSAVRGGVGT